MISDEEEEGQITIDGYKVYRRRWLVLLVSIVFAITGGIYRCRVPIVDIVYAHWDTNVDQVALMTFLPQVLQALVMIPFGRLLDLIGTRKIVSKTF